MVAICKQSCESILNALDAFLLSVVFFETHSADFKIHFKILLLLFLLLLSLILRIGGLTSMTLGDGRIQ